MTGPKNISHLIIAIITPNALLDVNMLGVTNTNFTIEAEEAGNASN